MYTLLASSGAMAQAPPEGSLCSKTEKEITTSDQCVRWWFGCWYSRLNFSGSKGDPRFSSITLEDRQRILLKTIFDKTEQTCVKFSYVEAEAAMRAKLLQIGK
jgi:hypothetical protein